MPLVLLRCQEGMARPAGAVGEVTFIYEVELVTGCDYGNCCVSERCLRAPHMCKARSEVAYVDASKETRLVCNCFPAGPCNGGPHQTSGIDSIRTTCLCSPWVVHRCVVCTCDRSRHEQGVIRLCGTRVLVF